MAVLEIYLETLTNFFEILHPPLKFYLENKSYSRDIADNVINVLSNVTAVSVIIYRHRSNESFVQENYISPSSSTNVNGPIHLLKTREHYEFIVKNPFNTNTGTLTHFDSISHYYTS